MDFLDDGFPDEFQCFLRRCVHSVDAAELAVYLSMMAKVPGSDGRVRYSAHDERSVAHVRMLSRAYKERPVTLFPAIYARS